MVYCGHWSFCLARLHLQRQHSVQHFEEQAWVEFWGLPFEHDLVLMFWVQRWSLVHHPNLCVVCPSDQRALVPSTWVPAAVAWTVEEAKIVLLQQAPRLELDHEVRYRGYRDCRGYHVQGLQPHQLRGRPLKEGIQLVCQERQSGYCSDVTA